MHIFISQCLVFELHEHITDVDAWGVVEIMAMALGCFCMEEGEIGRHPTNWLVHSYLEDKHYNSAGRLLQGTSFQTSGSQQSSSTSF